MISGFRVSDAGFAYARYENENKTFSFALSMSFMEDDF